MEVFDRALLGEICVHVITHAHESLFHDGSAVISSKGTAFGMMFHTRFFQRFHNL